MSRASLLTALALAGALCLSLGCGSERRRAAGDSAAGLDTSTPGDSSVAIDADFDSGMAMDSAAPFDGATDSGAASDGGLADTSVRDSGPSDTGAPDTGAPDTGAPDTGVPDTGPPPITIADIQRGLVAEGATVTLENMTVTGIYDLGAWVQDPALGPAYSGIRVYVGTPPAVALGDRVDVTGAVLDWFGDTEIDASSFTRRGAGSPLGPVSVTVSQAATEAYEGVLVRLTDARSFLSVYDCSVDDPGCSDVGLWRVSSAATSVVVYDQVYEDSDWASQVGDLRVVGIMSYRYGTRRILPRRASDLTP